MAAADPQSAIRCPVLPVAGSCSIEEKAGAIANMLHARETLLGGA